MRRLLLSIATLAALGPAAHALPEVNEFGVCEDPPCAPGGGFADGGYGSAWQGIAGVTESYLDAAGDPYIVTIYPDGTDAFAAEHGGLMVPTFSGDPVTDGTGELVWRETDVKLPGWGIPFVLVRTYASRRSFKGPLGFGWDHSYDQHITYKGCDHGIVHFSDGALSTIELVETTSNDPNVHVFAPAHGEGLRLERRASNAFPWMLMDTTTVTRSFDESGDLRLIDDGVGHALSLTWTHPAEGADQLSTVLDTTGRVIYFQYDGDDLACVTLDPSPQTGCLPANALVTYHYHTKVNRWLDHAADANGNGNSYTYDDWSFTPRWSPGMPDDQVAAACEASCGGAGSCPDTSCADAYHKIENTCQAQTPLPLYGWHSDPSLPKYPTSQVAVNASAYTVSADPMNVVDGQPGTQWTTSNAGSWWQVELPLPEPVAHVRLTQATGPHAKEVMVFVSARDCFSNTFDFPAGGQLPDVDGATLDVTFPREVARCVRIMVSSSWGSQGVGLAEAQLFSAGSERPLIDGANGAPDTMTGSACKLRAAAMIPYCAETTLDACEASCRAFLAPAPRSYGRLDDLMGNLLTITNADGVLVIKNVYGDDLTKPGFDKIVDQQVGPVDRGDRHVGWAYHDLTVETSPTDSHVRPLSAWSSLEICPAGGSSTTPDGLTVMSYGPPRWTSTFKSSKGLFPSGTPASAVVIRDTRGGARTKYFDRDWQLLREVDWHDPDPGQAAEQVSFNYAGGRLTAASVPGRGRVCLELDAMGQTSQRTELPQSGPDAARVTLYRRGADGQLTGVITDPLGTRGDEHLQRDGFGRATRVDRDVGGGKTVSTYMGYDDLGTRLDQPSWVATPWGGRRSVYCPNGVCQPQPQAVTINPEGVSTTTTFTYDSLGRVLTQTEGGVTTSTSYDAGGRPIHIARTVDASTEDTWLSYGGLDKPTWVWSSEKTTYYLYDAHGEPTLQIDWARAAATKNHCWNRDLVDGRVLDEMGPEGELTRYHYDELGRLLSVDRGWPDWRSGEDTSWATYCIAAAPPRGPAGLERVESALPGPGGMPATRTVGGVTTSYVYDGFGEPIDEIDGDGNHARSGYDARGRKVWQAVLGPTAGVWKKPSLGDAGLVSMEELGYDLLDRETRRDRWHFVGWAQVGATLATSTVHAYGDDTGHVNLSREAQPTETITEGTNAPAVITRDGAGRETMRRLPDGSVVTAQWQGDRRVVRSRPTPVGLLRSTEVYDAQHLLWYILDDDGAMVKQSPHDVRGRTLWEYTPMGGMRIFSHDGFGRLLSEQVSSDGNDTLVVRTEYDREDRAVAHIDARDKRTKETFDALGRRTALIDPQDRPVTTTYLPGSARPALTTDFSGTTHSFTYGAAGRLAWEYVHDGAGLATAGLWTIRGFTYTPAGQVQYATLYPPAGSARTVSFAYDSLGDVVQETSSQLPTELSVGHGWDGLGHVLSTTIGPDVVRRGFDALGRLSSVTLNGWQVAWSGYLGLGGPTVTWFGFTTGNVLMQHELPRYDKLGHMTDLVLNVWDRNEIGRTAASFHFAVGRDGVPRQRMSIFGSGPAWNDFFQVDQLGRVTGESRVTTGGPGPLPGYLGWAWWIQNSDVAPWVDRGQTPTARAFTLDKAHNRTKAVDATGTKTAVIGEADQLLGYGGTTVRADSAGDVTSFGTQAFGWNGTGQPITMRVGEVTHTYAYDALGRRISDSAGGKTTWLLWDGDELAGISAPTPDGAAPGAATFTLRIAGDGPDRHLALYDRARGVTGLRFLHQGDDRSVLAVTDSTATGVVEGYVYSAFGQPTVVNANGAVQKSGASIIGNRLQFQGQLADPDLGLVWMRSRVYQPAWGRFLSRDPIGIAGGLNPYVFVGGAPLALVDPSGHNPVAAAGAGADALMVPTFEGHDGWNDLLTPRFAMSTVPGDGLAYVDFNSGTHIFFNTMRAFGEFDAAMQANDWFSRSMEKLFKKGQDWMVIETDGLQAMRTQDGRVGMGGRTAMREHTIYMNERWGAGVDFLMGDQWDFGHVLVHEFGHAITERRGEDDFVLTLGNFQREVVDGLPPLRTHPGAAGMRETIINSWINAYNTDWEGFLVPRNQVDNLYPPR